MSEFSKKKIDCGFTSDIAGLIYGEISPVEKSNLEDHLRSCRWCTEDVAAFSAMRSSISQWRDTEFAGLATPSIAIQPLRPLETEAKGSVGEWIMSLLRPPVLAAFAMLIVAGFVLLLQFHPSAVETARDSVENPIGNISKDALREKQVTPDAMEVQPNLPTPDTVAKIPVNLRHTSVTKDKMSAPRTSVVRSSTAPIATPRSSVRPSDKSVAAGVNELPKLSEFNDSDEEALRLSDLLSEIDPG